MCGHLVGHDHAPLTDRGADGLDQGQNDFVLTIVVDVLELVVRDVTFDLARLPVFVHRQSVPFEIIDLARRELLEIFIDPSG